jgi:hypothetical protein
MAGREPRTAIIVDDSEALRESHARTMQAAGWAARGMSFEAAMAMEDDELLSLGLIVVDLHDARSTDERQDAVAAAGVSSQLPWYDRLAGIRLLYRLDELCATARRRPLVVVASAVMQIEPDLTGRMYELDVVTGGFSTLGIGTESVWLGKVVSATSPSPSREALRAGSGKDASIRWRTTVPRWRSYRTLIRTVDRHAAAIRFVLEDGGRPSRPDQRTLNAFNEQAGALDSGGGHPRRDALRHLLRKILGWELPHA